MLGHYALSEYAISEFPLAFVPPPALVNYDGGYKRGERKKHQELEEKLLKLRQLKAQKKAILHEQIASQIDPKPLYNKDVSRGTLTLPEFSYYEQEERRAQAELDRLRHLRYLRLEKERLQRIELELIEREEEELLILLM